MAFLDGRREAPNLTLAKEASDQHTTHRPGVAAEGLEVTDDVSIIEQLGLPVKLTRGEYTNLKVTTPDDMVVAGQILDQRAAAAV